MKIKPKLTFSVKFSKQLEFIAGDKPNASKKFDKKVKALIKKIPNFPYSNRKSIYFDNDNIRDLVIDGYTIVYKILKDEIEVFGFIKYEETLRINSNED